MVTNRRFPDLASFKREKARLNDLRELHEERLERHWQALGDRHVRGTLLKDVASDALHAWKPLGMLKPVVGEGGMLPIVAALIRSRNKGWGGKLFQVGLSILLPRLLKSVEGLIVGDISHKVGAAVERYKEYRAHRQQARAQVNGEYGT